MNTSTAHIFRLYFQITFRNIFGFWLRIFSDFVQKYVQILSKNMFRFWPKICSEFVREFVLFVNWNTYSRPHSQINRLGFVISKFGFSEHIFLAGLIFNLGPIFVPYTILQQECVHCPKYYDFLLSISISDNQWSYVLIHFILDLYLLFGGIGMLVLGGYHFLLCTKDIAGQSAILYQSPWKWVL